LGSSSKFSADRVPNLSRGPVFQGLVENFTGDIPDLWKTPYHGEISFPDEEE